MSERIKIKHNAEIEKVNYSQYKTNKTIQVKKYISEEDDTPIQALCQGTQFGMTSLMIAPTGSGKTYSVINTLKELNKYEALKAIFIVPNSIQVDQIANKYGIGGAYGDIRVKNVIENNNIIAMTWDKFGQLEKETVSDFIVFVDEIHQTYTDMFRYKQISKLYDNLEACKGQVHITATPNKLDFNKYGFIMEYKQLEQTYYNVKVYDKISSNKILNICNKSKKFLLLKNDIRFLNYVKASIPGKKIDVLESNGRNLVDVYNMIVNESNIGDFQGVCTTTMLTAGVDINDPDITDIIVIGEKDIATIKQFVARARGLKKCNVHIFNDFKEEKEISKIYTIEYIVNSRIEHYNNVVELHNSQYKLEQELTGIVDEIPSLGIGDKSFYWNKELKQYVVNEEYIRHMAYTNYYSKADIKSFKVLLEEYFNNVNIVKLGDDDNKPLKEYIKTTKEQKEEAIQFCLNNLSSIVGTVEVLTGSTSRYLEKYFDDNNINIDIYKQNLENIGIRNILDVAGMPKLLNMYTKSVIEDNLPYDLAFFLTNMSSKERGMFWGSIRNIIFREINLKYGDKIPTNRIEYRQFNLIEEYFNINVSYVKESLELFCEAANITIEGLSLTPQKLSEALRTLYVIDDIRTKDKDKLHTLHLLYKENILTKVCNLNKQIKLHTIKDRLTLDYLVEQYNLTDLSKRILQKYIDSKIKDVEVRRTLEDTKISLEDFNDIMNL